jgi:hypothetical protein
MTDQDMRYDLTSIARQAFDEEIKVVKDLTKNSEIPFARMSMTVTSKLVAFLGGDFTQPICNACYGTRMSS